MYNTQPKIKEIFCPNFWQVIDVYALIAYSKHLTVITFEGLNQNNNESNDLFDIYSNSLIVLAWNTYIVKICMGFAISLDILIPSSMFCCKTSNSNKGFTIAWLQNLTPRFFFVCIDGVYHQPYPKENCLGCPRIPVQSVSYNDARTLVGSVYIQFQILKLSVKHQCLLL